MQATAKAKHIRISPRKMRIVADVVRGQNVQESLNTLHFMPQKATTFIERTIQSAVANLLDPNQNDSDVRIDEEALIVKEIYVDEGPMLKRFQPVSRGRAHPILKRSSHLTVVVALPEDESEEA
ncbi:MAG: 50S ribosomal protein L22 [Bacteroidota bacterium]